jgi:CRISPR-associated endonuclease/helicase Cas3
VNVLNAVSAKWAKDQVAKLKKAEEKRKKKAEEKGDKEQENKGADKKKPAMTEDEMLAGLLAPKQSAPTLLPAYLDLWAQTSPAPSQLPDVSLWLHGPSAGPADVQVLWRADLSEEVLQPEQVEVATAIVAAVRPSSLEAISLPFVTARAWLANQPTRDLGDTEGATPEDSDEPKTAGRRALRWRGDESEIVWAQSDSEPSLKPGDTIVVPVSYGGIRCGCFDATSTEPVQDRAEQAELFARARPVLRLHPIVVDKLGLSLPLDEPDEARTALGLLASNGDWPAWKRLWAGKLAQGRGSLVVSGEPSWTVIEGRRVPLAALREVLQPEETLEDGVELTTDSDDSFHAGRAVSLAEHSADVETFAHEYATRCGLGTGLVEHVALAAWLHDIGKTDRRFQLMLRGGSEIEYFKDETPWAKSKMPPGAREAHRLAQNRSGYPRGARHEVQSLAMLDGQKVALTERLKKRDSTKERDLDLVLHLVASHHGYCRPFAPAVVDDSPVDVTLAKHASKTFGEIDFASTTSCNELHRLDSPLADRFWVLVAKYGWQELCWLEAILRLADHRASEEEQAKP